jgi:hypothetical protein
MLTDGNASPRFSPQSLRISSEAEKSSLSIHTIIIIFDQLFELVVSQREILRLSPFEHKKENFSSHLRGRE